MQIINLIACDTSKGSLYKQIKPCLVGEHAFPLTGLVCESAHIIAVLAFGHSNQNSGNQKCLNSPRLPAFVQEFSKQGHL